MPQNRLRRAGINLPRGLSRGNDLRLARYRKAPELGPRLLFFSGGTALRSFSQVLAGYTHNSIHLVTPFDSGGSSAELRKAFAMPAVGDLRARLLSLADNSVTGHPDIAALFSHRLGGKGNRTEPEKSLQELVAGRHRLLKAIAEPMRSLIQSYIREFSEQKPEDFHLSGASVGNLILTGGYLLHNRSLDPIAFLFSQLIRTRGTVRTTTDADLQLQVSLQNGRTITGQHRFTGKETAEINSPIATIRLTGEAEDVDARGESKVCKETRKLIDSAELLVFPPGSFYSSVIANLLPKGVTKALDRNPAPRVYVPSLGTDLETLGMTLADQVAVLGDHLGERKEGDGKGRPAVDFLLFDSRLLAISENQARQIQQSMGVQIVDVDLACEPADLNRYDDTKLAEALLALT